MTASSREISLIFARNMKNMEKISRKCGENFAGLRKIFNFATQSKGNSL